MNPNARGAPAGAITMGMSRVAFFAAMIAGVICEATITIDFALRTSSTASVGKETVALPSADPNVDLNSFAFNITKVSKRLLERTQDFRTGDQKDADARHLRLLCTRGARPHNRYANQRYEFAASHGIPQGRGSHPITLLSESCAVGLRHCTVNMGFGSQVTDLP